MIDAVKRWEKRVVVTGVSFDDSPQNIDRNLLPVHISYRVIQSQVEGNLVYPFYREPRQVSQPRQFRASVGK
ncbi:GPW/gp25 family protein [Desulfosarcina cetonica]|uniref:GPW/gp25 family protein n=1 Tax=Desulfosarcina cetonica TaxID=90730 RepID=UPI001C443CCC|nr:GPW/gp25 family protein [Desulfosarcina cetonica]